LINPDLAQAIIERLDGPGMGLRLDQWDYIETLAHERFWPKLMAEWLEVPIDPRDCIASALVDYGRQSTK